ncbi:hypothetical protein, partial [Vibrio tasmaniensis]|uniref:hypothetical protein n=3 Tax=Vibrio TaxID=662 RepID=UPI001A7E0AD7
SLNLITQQSPSGLLSTCFTRKLITVFPSHIGMLGSGRATWFEGEATILAPLVLHQELLTKYVNKDN